MTQDVSQTPAQNRRDQIARGLLLIAALGALFSFFGAIGTVAAAKPTTVVVEVWRMYGFLVFAGLFTLLAVRLRACAGVWELVIFHKLATAITAAFLIRDGATDAPIIAVIDGILALMALAAYLLAKGYMAWSKQ